MNEITVYEFARGGLRVVKGPHSISAESGVPTAIRSYRNIVQAYAGERGAVREVLVLMM